MFITTLAIIMTDGIIQLAQIWGNCYIPLLKFTDHVAMLKGTQRPCLLTSGAASRSAHGSPYRRGRGHGTEAGSEGVMRGRSFGVQAERTILLFSGLVLIVSVTFEVDYSLIWIIWIHIFVYGAPKASTETCKLGLHPLLFWWRVPGWPRDLGTHGHPRFSPCLEGISLMFVDPLTDKPEQLLANTLSENTFECQQGKFTSQSVAHLCEDFWQWAGEGVVVLWKSQRRMW